MSQCVVHKDTVYLAGQVDGDASPTAGEQTKRILERIDRLLATAGTDKSKLLTATIWLSDVRFFLGDERSLGRLGESRQHASTRLCRGQARKDEVSRRDRRHGGALAAPKWIAAKLTTEPSSMFHCS